MDILGASKNNINNDQLEKLDRSFQELANKSDGATLEEVQELSLFVSKVKAEVEKSSSPYMRFFSGIKNMSLHLKIKGYEGQLETLKDNAEKNREGAQVQKAIWDLQKKGLILPLTLDETKEAFLATADKLKAIGGKSAFTYIIQNRQEGLVDLVTYSDERAVESQTVSLKEPLQLPVGVPLSQLQEVANWLGLHGQVTLLGTKAIEEKLSKLMDACPHGAYVLHTADNALTLSRLTPAGKISHLKIDLQKELGCYTIELSGKQIAASRLEFKKRLEQSGTPVGLKDLAS